MELPSNVSGDAIATVCDQLLAHASTERSLTAASPGALTSPALCRAPLSPPAAAREPIRDTGPGGAFQHPDSIGAGCLSPALAHDPSASVAKQPLSNIASVPTLGKSFFAAPETVYVSATDFEIDSKTVEPIDSAPQMLSTQVQAQLMEIRRRDSSAVSSAAHSEPAQRAQSPDAPAMLSESQAEPALPAAEQLDATPNCFNCGSTCRKPLRCGRCKLAIYCTAQCQKQDWFLHRRACASGSQSDFHKSFGSVRRSGDPSL